MTSRTPFRDTDTVGHVQDGDRRSGSGIPKYYTINTVAAALDVSGRTIRRWISNGDLIVHRVNGVVRIAEGDLRAFLALHREG